MRSGLTIVYENDDVIIVNKPAGMLSIPDRFHPEWPSVVKILSDKYGKVYTVHRLDKFTSGLLLFAKSEAAHKVYSNLWMERVPQKFYIAIVDGRLKEKQGSIQLALRESNAKRGKMVVSASGKESLTQYDVIEEMEAFSLVSLKIYTGRMHQIRVHMAAMGHPLVVDPLYGKREAFYISELKGKKYRLKKEAVERPLISRQPLHAHRLIIKDEEQQIDIDVSCDIPKDMRALLNQIKKWSKK